MGGAQPATVAAFGPMSSIAACCRAAPPTSEKLPMKTYRVPCGLMSPRYTLVDVVCATVPVTAGIEYPALIRPDNLTTFRAGE
jgi:hypothetical protein